MSPEDLLGTRSGSDTRRLELSDHLPSADDDKRLTTMLDGIEQIRKAA